MLYQRVRDRVCSCDSESFEEGFVGEFAEEALPRILDEEVEDDEGAQLSVEVTIFSFGKVSASLKIYLLCVSKKVLNVHSQLLAQSATGFRWSARLDANNFDQVDDAGRVFNFIRLTGEDLNLHSHR